MYIIELRKTVWIMKSLSTFSDLNFEKVSCEIVFKKTLMKHYEKNYFRLI